MTSELLIKALENFWPRNKAKGLLAQTVFMQEVKDGSFGKDAKEKFLHGCWLLSPKNSQFYKFRFCFFIHPAVLTGKEAEASPKEILGDLFRPFHALSEFMNNAGIGVLYVIPVTNNGKLPLENIVKKDFTTINWILFSFENGRFILRDAPEFFGRWEGNRGRASIGGNWDPQIKKKIQKLDEKILTELLINEMFYAGFLKSILKKPLNDPYDVDLFLVSISQKHIFPMEIKEKFPWSGGSDKFFGIDAGRIMMLLRLCLPNDANSVYLIRELDEEGRFIGWKYITLSDIIMTASWNLQAGGPGMGGQSTQTIRLPYAYFKKFAENELTEENLKIIGNMPKDIKTIAKQFGEELSEKFNNR